MKNPSSLQSLHRILLMLAGLLLLATIKVPLWRIELDAAQYPEGLELLIYSYKLDGQVDIINGLNHYIGMKTLHTEDFIEFTILPYMLGAFAIAFITVGSIANYRGLQILLVSFVVFGVVAMVDFWLWEYNYGHHLDPSAPIKVPGMAYQPPLIGFKELLNFGAYSVPDLGGWMIVAAGLVLFYCLVKEWTLRKKA